MEDIVIYTKG